MAYVTQTWFDYPNTTTPITAARLNHMEAGIASAVAGAVPDGLMPTIVENSDGTWDARPTGLDAGTYVTWVGPDFPPVDSTHAKINDFAQKIDA